jgi:mannose-binding lectin 2
MGDNIQSSVGNNIKRELAATKGAFDAQLNEHKSAFDDHKEEIAKSGGGMGWMIPFVILVVVVVAGFGMAYSKYQELRKSHLL